MNIITFKVSGLNKHKSKIVNKFVAKKEILLFLVLDFIDILITSEWVVQAPPKKLYYIVLSLNINLFSFIVLSLNITFFFQCPIPEY